MIRLIRYYFFVEFQRQAECLAVVGGEVGACGKFRYNAIVELHLFIEVEHSREQGADEAAIVAEYQ